MKNVITVASGNSHKLKEISQILGVPVRGLKEIPNPPELIEDGESFEANALIKARGLRDALGEWTLADDSGLAVDALEGRPGIHSARYAGTHGDDQANNDLLLKHLEGKENRGAAFVCVIALCGPCGEEWVIRGECRGQILHAPSGTSGFGYDPLFVPDGYRQSFAELGDEVKSRISHRAHALRQLVEHPDAPLTLISSGI
jgi:XTP/dITP diphosphohydrolase